MVYLRLPDIKSIKWYVDYGDHASDAIDRIVRVRREIAEVDYKLQKQLKDNGWLI